MDEENTAVDCEALDYEARLNRTYSEDLIKTAEIIVSRIEAHKRGEGKYISFEESLRMLRESDPRAQN